MSLHPDGQDSGAEPGGAARPRPALHFAPARNWMNDPNGLIQRNGRVHLFYQHNPGGPTPQHMSWGHASSTDLWNWADHPLALEPAPDGPDRDGCWSGCAVVHDEVAHLLYTGRRDEVTLPCLATAADQDLIRWSRGQPNPVIAVWPPERGVSAFRDHSAWRDGPFWYQVIGGGLADRGGALFLYRSPDLRNWQYLGIFAAAADYGLPGQVWECPDVFTVGRTTVVIVSVMHEGPGHAMWLTGETAGGRFAPQASGRCDMGERYYAPQSLPLADGRRIAIGWLRESLGELTGRDRTRVGVMSLPRELFLEGGQLRARPARELDSARGQRVASQVIEGRGAVNVRLSARQAAAAEFEFITVRGDPGVIRLRLKGVNCADAEIEIQPGRIMVYEGGRRLTSDSPAAPSVPATGPVTLYYDNGILEVYEPSASPVAVICDRNARYERLEVDLRPRPRPGSLSGAVKVNGWSSGRALPGSGDRAAAS